MANNTANIKAVITADDKASKVLAGVGDSFTKLLKASAVGVAAIGGAAIAFGVSAVKSFEESENAAAQLNAVLKSTGGAAGVTADQANDLASSLQKVTRFSDETIIGGENLLLTFTKIGKDIFPQATETMLNMSQALGQDVKASAIQLGKALQDPILGVTALRRVGVNFSQAQQDVIKKLVDTGKTAEAQKLILQELQTEFGNSARAAGETFAGKLDILKNSFDDIKESIGKTLVDAITPFATQLSNFIASDKFQAWLQELNKWLAVNIPIAINWVKDEGLPALKKAFELAWPVVQTLTNMFIDLVNYLSDHEYVFWGIVTVMGAIKLAMMLDGALKAFTFVIGGAAAEWQGLTSLMSAPIIIPALGLGLVFASIANMLNNWRLAKSEIDQKAADARATIDNIYNFGTPKLQALRGQLVGINGQLAEAAQSQLLKGGIPQSAINRQLGVGGYAMGGFTGQGGTNEVAGVVHKGEYVIPKSAVDQTTGMPKVQVGNTTPNISLNVNVGMYAGTEMEKRKIAQALFQALQDMAASKNTSVGKMMGI